MENNRLKTSHILAFAAGGLLITAAIIWRFASYASAAPAASQVSIIVAIVALVGTLWTAAITLAGLLLKDSLDRRNAMLQSESEKRLRMDTALRAVEIISKAEVAGAPVHEAREAAILVIASLGQLRLALTLGEQFWKGARISSGGFMLIANQCLISDDETLKEDACSALRENYAKLCIGPDLIEFPDNFCMKWKGDLPVYAKVDLLFALLEAMLSKDFSYWNRGTINWIIYCLYKMFMNDQEKRLRYTAAMCSIDLCNMNEINPGDWIMPMDVDKITYAEIRQRAADVISSLGELQDNISGDDYELAARVKGWKDRPPVESAPARRGPSRPRAPTRRPKKAGGTKAKGRR